jgi:hypothetical protein
MTDEDTLNQRVTELEDRVNDIESLIHDGQTNEVTGMREFVLQTDPETHTDRALAIGYFLDRFQNQEHFTRSDIEDGYRTCRFQKPANMSDVLGSLRDQELTMNDGERGQSQLHRLTGKGIDTVEEMMENGT